MVRAFRSFGSHAELTRTSRLGCRRYCRGRLFISARIADRSGAITSRLQTFSTCAIGSGSDMFQAQAVICLPVQDAL
jgi:hypothetical protein